MHPKVVSARRMRAVATCVAKMESLIEILKLKTEAPEIINNISGKQAREPGLADVIRLEAVATFLKDLEAQVKAEQVTATPKKPARKVSNAKAK